tara:strand:- start:740 stop:1132 length:393 start_codon:yes stop_codon:yes gene_type:complete
MIKRFDIEQCDYEEIAFIPKNYDTENACFSIKKKPEIWFKATIDEVVGCCSLLILSQTRVRFRNNYVIPQYREVGIGKALIVQSELWAKKNNFKVIDVRGIYRTYLHENYEIKAKYTKRKPHQYWYEKNI